jgi:hypothetical protein
VVTFGSLVTQARARLVTFGSLVTQARARLVTVGSLVTSAGVATDGEPLGTRCWPHAASALTDTLHQWHEQA